MSAGRRRRSGSMRSTTAASGSIARGSDVPETRGADGARAHRQRRRARGAARGDRPLHAGLPRGLSIPLQRSAGAGLFRRYRQGVGAAGRPNPRHLPAEAGDGAGPRVRHRCQHGRCRRSEDARSTADAGASSINSSAFPRRIDWTKDARMELKSKSLAQERFGTFAATYATSRSHAKGGSLPRLVELLAPQTGADPRSISRPAPAMSRLRSRPMPSHVVASDLTPQMLAVARGLAAERHHRQRRLRRPARRGAAVRRRHLRHRDLPDRAPSLRRRAGVRHRGGAGAAARRPVRPRRERLARSQHHGGRRRRRSPPPPTNTTPSRSTATRQPCALPHARRVARPRRRCRLDGAPRRIARQADGARPLGRPAERRRRRSRATCAPMLLDGSPAFRAFARPQENKGDVDFVLTEAVIIAQK